MDIIKDIKCYFDIKNSRIEHYLEIEKSIQDKKDELNILAIDFQNYKKDCEELIKGSELDNEKVSDNVEHVKDRFNKYFVNYVNDLSIIKKSIEDLIQKKEEHLVKYPDIKEDIEKGEIEVKKFSKKDKFKTVMEEYSNGTLHSGDGSIVTDREQALAIAYSESGMKKAEVDEAIITLVKAYEDGLIEQVKFQEIRDELKIFLPVIEKSKDTVSGGKADNKTIKDVADYHKVKEEDIKKQLKIGIKVEKEHVGNDKEKAKEIAMDHLWEQKDYYTAKKPEDWAEKELESEKSEENEIEKAKKVSKKRYADAILRDNKDFSKILFLRRSNDSDFEAGKYGLPGGHVDEGEEPEEAMKREVKEETGIELEKYFKVAESVKPEIHYFESDIDSSLIVLEGEEHKNLKWMTLDECKEEELIVGLKDKLYKIYNVEYNIKKV